MSRPSTSRAAEQAFFAALAYTEAFFMGHSKVHRALEKLARVLDETGIPYAVVGAMALNAYGYTRATQDIDVLLTGEGLEAFRRAHLGRGYVEVFPGRNGFRDAENDVRIDVVLAGDYPGDGRPKPVAFPDPKVAAIAGTRVRLLPLERLIELKLASGLSAAHRLRDLADVLELIRACALQESFSDALHPMVREKYAELWRAAQTADPE